MGLVKEVGLDPSLCPFYLLAESWVERFELVAISVESVPEQEGIKVSSDLHRKGSVILA